MSADSPDDDGASTQPTHLFGNAEIPAFRTVDDFILEKSRFESPPFNDFPRWNNRIVSNLLYYQTNYYLVFFGLVLFTTFFYGQDMALGMTAICLVTGTAFFSISPNPRFHELRREHPLITLGSIVVSFYLFISLLASVFVVAFACLFPLALVLIHASCRLRNFSSKVSQQTERFGLKTTVMGQLLDFMGVKVKA